MSHRMWRSLALLQNGNIVRLIFPDKTPPTVTLSATPSLLRPTGQSNGACHDLGQGHRFRLRADGQHPRGPVIDEYGPIQPTRQMTRDSAGNYSFTTLLRACCEENDADGRLYTMLNLRDNAGNRGAKSISVRVPL